LGFWERSAAPSPAGRRSCEFGKPLEACEPTLESEIVPEHRVSLESNERKFLSLTPQKILNALELKRGCGA